jgi:heme O synthase-like polyprenyltransferase
VLSGAILLWQMPHAWLVQLRHRDDCECLPLPLFCRGLSNGQLRRLVFTWSAAFAALPPLVVLLVGGKWHSALLACALLLMVLLTAAGLPLLGRDEAPRLYPRLEAALRLGLLLLLGLVVFAARTPA